VKTKRSCALQSVRRCCSTTDVTAWDRPLLELRLVQSPLPAKVVSLLVRHSRFAVSPRLGLAVFPEQDGRACYCPTKALFEFRLPLESYPAIPSPPAEAGQLLSWASGPYST
jgi:hypothetical protein